jgi:hypothetical protein
MYESPIEIITKQMRTQFEDNVFKAIQDYGIVVDRDELIKALQYDREQYDKGFADGMLARKDEWISVDERLPDKDDIYLVCLSGLPADFDRFVLCEDEDFTGYFEHSKVTHWLPIPEAPKGGE